MKGKLAVWLLLNVLFSPLSLAHETGLRHSHNESLSLQPANAVNLDYSGPNSPYLAPGTPQCPNRSGCQTIQLGQQDVERLWKLLFSGERPFGLGASVEGGSVTGNEASTEKFTTTDESGENAKDQEFPKKEISALDNFLSGNTCGGPYSYAIRVKDDVRIAQCRFSTDDERDRQECEGISSPLDKENPVVQVATALNAADDLGKLYETKDNTVIAGTFDSKMICSSQDSECTFTLFSEYEKTFNFTQSLVDVTGIVLPFANHFLTNKLYGDASLLAWMGFQGETPKRIPILANFVKANHQAHYWKQEVNLISNKFAGFQNQLIKDSWGTGDVILVTHSSALNSGAVLQKLENETLRLERVLKRDRLAGLAVNESEDLIQHRTAIGQIKGNVRSAIAGDEKARFQAGGGYLAKGNIAVTHKDWADKAVRKPGIPSSITDHVQSLEALEKRLGVTDLFDWEPNLNWQRLDNYAPTPADIASFGGEWVPHTDSSLYMKNPFDGKIYQGDKSFAVQPWDIIGNHPRLLKLKKDPQYADLYNAMSDDQQWMVDSIMAYDPGWKAGWDISFKQYRDGGYLRRIPNEGLFTTTIIPKTEAGQAAKALLEKSNEFVGKPFYYTFLMPTGRLVMRSGGSEILNVPPELTGFATAYRVPRTWDIFSASPGKDSEGVLHDIYKDAYLDVWYNKENDNGLLLEKWFYNVTLKLGETLPKVGDKLAEQRDQKKRLGHTADGLVWQTTVAWDKPAQFEGAPTDQTFSIAPCLNDLMPDGETPCSGDAVISATSPRLRTVALENTKKEDAEHGPVLLSYYHHLDLKGRFGASEKENSVEGQGINLQKAIEEDKECASNPCAQNWFVNAPVFENLNISVASLATATNNNIWPVLGATVGGGPATFLGGFVGTATAQWVINAYCIDECIDTSGGYYVTANLNPNKGNITTNTTVSEELSGLGEQLIRPTGATPPKSEGDKTGEQNPLFELLDAAKLSEVDENIKALVGEVAGEHPKVLQLQVDSTAALNDSGQLVEVNSSLNAHGLYSAFVGGTCDVTTLPVQEKTIALESENGGRSIEIRQSPEEANICAKDSNENNNCMLSASDEGGEKRNLVNLAAPDIPLGVYKIPQKIVRVSLSGQEPVMRLTVNPQKFLVNGDFFACAKDYAACGGVSSQGVSQEDITPLVGRVLTLQTTNGHTVSVNSNTLSINGPLVKRQATPKDSFLTISSNGLVELHSPTQAEEIGSIASIVTTKASFIRDATQPNSLLFWLKTLAEAASSQISGASLDLAGKDCASKTTGFNLQFGPDPNNPQAIRDVQALNSAVKSMGPMQVWETEKSIYMLTVEDLPTGGCDEKLTVIDKETGRVEEFQVSGIEKIAPNEFLLKTDKGDQRVKFEEDNGRLFVQFADRLAEVVTKLTGKNGTLIYDVENGIWKALNAQTIPLIDAIKQGLSLRATDDGRVVGTPGTNIAINVPSAGSGGFFQLPWGAENALQALLFAVITLAGVLAIRLQAARKAGKKR